MTQFIDLAPSWTILAFAIPTLVIAYIIFGIAGFGTALIAAPVLAQIMPVATIVPLLALLDCLAAIVNGVTLSDRIAKRELMWLVPLMIAGSLVGAWLLLVVPAKPMMLALGIFVVGYALYALFTPAARVGLKQVFVVPFGLIGGVFSAMFGSGGFIYAMYLSRRLDDKNAMRATQSALIALSTFTRVIIFALVGIYSDLKLLALALLLAPAMLIGLYAGHHITLRMTREQFLRVLSLVLIATGTTLILRALTGGIGVAAPA
jgi:uncharacterized membrane protein YfcA